MRLQRILCPVDFSECSLRAFEFAAELASRCRAALEVVHVWQPSGRGVAYQGPMSAVVGEEAEIGRALEKLYPSNRDVACQHHLLVGEPVEEIIQLATERQIDLIVIGTHGRTGLSRWILGSVAETILHTAPCPVLTCKLLPRTELSHTPSPNISFAT